MRTFGPPSMMQRSALDSIEDNLLTLGKKTIFKADTTIYPTKLQNSKIDKL